MKYYVILIDKNDEHILLNTDDKDKAITRTKEEMSIIKRDKRGDCVEIRQYVEDIENDDCKCFDYNTIAF